MELRTVAIRGGPIFMAKSHVKLVAPTEESQTVAPKRRPNAELRTREHLTSGEVVALLCGEIDRALLGEIVEPGVILRRQVVVGEVVESEAPYRTAHRAELLVDGLVVP